MNNLILMIEKSAARRFDKVIKGLVNEGNIEKLEGIARQSFGGHRAYTTNELDSNVSAISRIINSDNDNSLKRNALGDFINRASNSSRVFKPTYKIEPIMAKAHDYSLKYGGPAGSDKYNKVKADYINERKRMTQPKSLELDKEKHIGLNSFDEWHKRDPEELINIEHGGGLDHLTKFIEGKNKGYPLEAHGGYGIQVSPMPLDDRSNMYAIRAGSKTLDKPAMLSGQIKAKYLQAAPKDFEAGLRADNLQYIQNLKVNKVDPRSRPEMQRGIDAKTKTELNDKYNIY